MQNVIRPDDIGDYIKSIDNAEILVGIPSYNNANTISHIVGAVQASFAVYFPKKKAVLVNSDGGSTDGTMEGVQKANIDSLQSILLSHKVNPFIKIATPYHGGPGEGSAFRGTHLRVYSAKRRRSAGISKFCYAIESHFAMGNISLA
jgi:glucosylglycerate synthase